MKSNVLDALEKNLMKLSRSVERVTDKYSWADMVVRYSVSLGTLILFVVLLPILAPFALWGSFLKDEGEE